MPGNGPVLDDLQFAGEDRLRHEITYLRDRLTNLEVFKRMFFILQEDLVEERHRSAELELRVKGNADNTEIADLPATDTAAQIDQLKQELQGASNMAMLSMATAGEYSALIDFFRDSGSAKNYQDMVMLLFVSAASYGCEISAEVRCLEGELIFSQNEEHKLEHTSLLKRLKIKGRVVEESGALCINYENISLLVSDLPKDDIDKYGRIKDNLVVLASGANSVVESLDARVKLVHERKNLYKIVKGTHLAMRTIEKGIGDQIRKTDTLQNKFIKSLRNALEGLDVSGEEKYKINSLITRGKKSLSKVLMETFVLDEHFLDIITKLEKTYSVVESADKKTQINSVVNELTEIVK